MRFAVPFHRLLSLSLSLSLSFITAHSFDKSLLGSFNHAFLLLRPLSYPPGIMPAPSAPLAPFAFALLFLLFSGESDL